MRNPRVDAAEGVGRNARGKNSDLRAWFPVVPDEPAVGGAPEEPGILEGFEHDLARSRVQARETLGLGERQLAFRLLHEDTCQLLHRISDSGCRHK